MVRHALALAPVLFAGFVGLTSRSYWDPFEVPSNTAAQDRAILIYRPYVDAANKALAKGDPAMIVSAATTWDEGIRAARLLPLRTSSYEDSTREGVKAEIVRANTRLVNALLRDAKSSRSGLTAEQRADRALLAIRVAEGVKYSDFRTVYDAGNRERRALDILSQVSTSLDEKAKARVREGLERVALNNAELNELTISIRRQYYEYVQRSGKEPVSIEDMRRTVRLSERVASAKSGDSSLALVSNPLLASNETAPEFLTELRVAWRQEASLQRDLAALVAALR